ncbi:hypothetical protein H7Y40_02430 [Pedobacter sp.]|nr:hypothetical protein [Candidatus Saccharibacteria bacterium]
MDTTKTVSTGSHTTKSELEKFKLFYEYVVPEKELRAQAKLQRPVRRNNNG